MSLDIGTALPEGFYMPPLVSADTALGDRTFIEIPSESGIEFSASNPNIEFNIVNSRSFLDTQNSYLRFDLQVTQANGSSTSQKCYISEGGSHALFKTVEILTASNTQIERIEAYNKFYAMVSSMTQSQEYVNQIGHREGDSADGASGDEFLILTGTVSAPGGATTLTGSGTLFESEVSVGNNITVRTDTGDVVYQIATITSDTVLTTSANIALTSAGALVGIQRPIAPTGDEIPARKSVCDQGSGKTRLCMQPLSGFLESKEVKALPFFAGSGIKLRFTLADAWECFSFAEEKSGTGYAVTFKIFNPVYVANLVAPREAVFNDWYAQYKSGSLTYEFVSPFSNIVNTASNAATAFNYTINSGIRSAKGFMMRLQNTRATAQSAAGDAAAISSWTCDSVAQGLKVGLSSFQVNAGGQYYFPLSRPMDTSATVGAGYANCEILAHMQSLYYSLGNILQSVRFKSVEWRGVRSAFNIFERGNNFGSSEPQRLIIGCRLAKDPSGMSGIDLSANNLIVSLNFETESKIFATMATATAATASNRTLVMYILHDRYVTLSADKGTVVRF